MLYENMTERRKFLASVSTVAVGGLAGCNITSTDTDSNEERSKSTENQSAADEKQTQEQTESDSTQQAQIISLEEDRISSFGDSVAASANGSTAMIGAPGANSVYVYANKSGELVQQAKLVPEDGDNGDLFGNSVAISNDGTIALIGSYLDKGSTDYQAGSVYVFVKSNSGWNQQTKIMPDDNNRVQFFGSSIAMTGDGTAAVIGATLTINSDDEELGATYVFSNTNQGWMQETKLTANNPDTGSNSNEFGFSVDISEDGETVVTGAPHGPSGVNLAGRAYTFVKEQGEWRQQDEYYASDTNRAYQFGNSVSVTDNGNTAVIGAFHNDDPRELAGSAYVFSNTSGEWTQQHKFSRGTSISNSEFGGSVDISGDSSISIVGARNDSPGGAAYVFTQTNNSWSRQSKFPRDESSNFRRFGRSLALSNDGSTAFISNTKLVGEENQVEGNVYVYTL